MYNAAIYMYLLFYLSTDQYFRQYQSFIIYNKHVKLKTTYSSSAFRFFLLLQIPPCSVDIDSELISLLLQIILDIQLAAMHHCDGAHILIKLCESHTKTLFVTNSIKKEIEVSKTNYNIIIILILHD